jgi:RHS repeat-associated protein
VDSVRREKYAYSKRIGFSGKAMAVAVFAFMIGSQIVSYGGPGTVLGSMFPSAAFGTSLQMANSGLNQLQTGSIQAFGHPLPPGTVSDYNSWNNSKAMQCPASKVPSQPLSLSTGGNWTLQTAVPNQLFMNKNYGTKIVNQTYQVFSNGTVSVSDSNGNSFAWTLLDSLPSLTRTSSLVSNSTEAIQNTTVYSVGGQVLANITIVYTLKKQFCNDAGMEVAVAGTANWGVGKTGLVSFQFTKRPFSVNGSTAWFGNNSNTLIGFDWTATESLKPTFQNISNRLSYVVGSNFSIDPTVISSLSSNLFPSSNGHTIIQDNGYYWVVWGDYISGSANTLRISSSLNGSVWSTPTTISTDYRVLHAAALSPGTHDLGVVYWEPQEASNGYNPWVIFQEIILNANGTATIGPQRQVLQMSGYSSTIGAGFAQTSIVWSTKNNRWLVGTAWVPAGVNQPIGVYEAVNSNVNGSGSWTVYNPATLCYFCDPQVEVLSNEYVILRSDNVMYAASSVNTGFSGAGSVQFTDYSSTVLPNSTVVVAGISYPYGTHLYYLKSSNWTAYTNLANISDTGTLSQTSVVADSRNNTFVMYVSSTKSISSIEVMAGKGVIGPSTLLQQDPVQVSWFDAPQNLASYTIPLIWESGISPLNLEIGLAPLIVPTAATSGQPWGKPGISPYESYFTQLSEYVSPGNGLLGIGQTDLSLPGRGLNLTLTRIFSTPYSFYTSGTNRSFDVDNFTLARLGIGWELSLPWLGTYYVHLWDGQAYAYNWTGNVFLNHKGENFALYSNATNNSLSLFNSAGVRYYFNSNLKLTSITDATGNNTISLSYTSGTTGHITNITDTVGRIIAFKYFSNGQLHNITSGALMWTYAYSGSNLQSVTDPAGRVTTYSYFIGSNAWLIKQINYPTGALTNYTYGSAPVSPGVHTYYVTSQDVYSSSHSLDKSTQFNYQITNGLVTYCNTTIADVTGTNQSRINFVYSSASKSTQVNEFANKSIIIQTENDYDTFGRINESKTISPTNSVLAYSTTRYDNWGNVIYTNSTIGQETWFSYANTNTTNKFYNKNYDQVTSFGSNFYSNNTIYSNIHDLLIGKAQFQNGNGSGPVTIQTYFNYNSAGELLHIKQSHIGGWLVSTYTHDSYGNVLTATDPLGRVTDYQYSSAYGHAYLTDQSTLVSNSGPTATFGIDGTGSQAAGASAVSFLTTTLTTTKPDIIIVGSESSTGSGYPSITSIKDTAGLIWHSRKVLQQHGIGTATDYFDTEEWYAYSTLPLTSDTINVSISIATKKFAINVFGVSGANNGNPFDPNSGLPATAVGTSTSPSVSISTNNANDIILGLFMQNGGSTFTAGSGYSTITSAKSTGTFTIMYSEDKVVTSTQSGLAVKATYATSVAWMVIADALVKATVTNVSSAYAYNSTTGWRTTYMNPNGQNTTYKYDNLGRLTTQIYPAVSGIYANTTYVYNDTANTMKTIDARGNYTIQHFDGLERLASAVQYNGTLIYAHENYTYNYLDLQNSSTTAERNTTSYTYDPLGFQTKITYPTGAVQTNSYNYQNNTKTVIDPDGHKTVYAYDWAKDLLWVREFNSSSNYYLTTYSYDKSQNLLSITDAKSNVTSYSHDDLNRLTLTTFPDSTTQSQSYDAMGNAVGKVDPNGNVMNYTYDSLNRLIILTYPGHLLENYTYDNDGNAKVMTDFSGVTYYSYDTRDRLTNETQVNTVGSQKISTILYSYDKTSNIISMTYPDGTVLGYTYDALNRIAHVGSYANFTYTLDNQIKSISYASKVTTKYTYDAMDRPLSIIATNSSHTFESLSYTYDLAGNLISLNSPTYTYTYDNLNRLNSSTGPWGTINYTYDPAGNRVKLVQGSTTTTYTYTAYNRLNTATTSGSTISYTFNHNGDLTKLVNGSNTWKYYYNFDNDLVGVSKNSATSQNSTYNAAGDRITNKLGSSTIIYLYQRNNNVYQINVTGSTTDYFFANGIQVSSKVGSSNPTYFLVDNLKSTRLTTSNIGDIQFSSDYKPYGIPYSQSGSPVPQFQYTGKITDSQATTGLYYLGARYYDTNTGRFLTEDTNAGNPTDPMSLNRYIYVRDNPMTLVDPTGNRFALSGGPVPTGVSSGTPGAQTTYTSCSGNCAYSQSGATTGQTASTQTNDCGYFGCGTANTVYSLNNDCGYFGCSAGSATYGSSASFGILGPQSGPFPEEQGTHCGLQAGESCNEAGAIAISGVAILASGLIIGFSILGDNPLGVYAGTVVGAFAVGSTSYTIEEGTNANPEDATREGTAEAGHYIEDTLPILAWLLPVF